MRARAILYALSYGIRPWWMYERVSHYAPMTYRQHLLMNLRLAWRWLTRQETRDDVLFEIQVNGADDPRAEDTDDGWAYRIWLAQAVHENDHDVADGHLVTASQLNSLEAHDFCLTLTQDDVALWCSEDAIDEGPR